MNERQEELDKIYKEKGAYPARKKLFDIYGWELQIKGKDVYFIRCLETGRIKIGMSDNVLSRFSQINATSPTNLEVMFVIEYGGEGLERHFHEKFRECRYKLEWFTPNAEMLSMISDMQRMVWERQNKKE